MTTNVSKFLIFSFSDKTVSIFDPFKKFSLIRESTGSGLEREFTDRVSKVYRIKCFAENPKT